MLIFFTWITPIGRVGRIGTPYYTMSYAATRSPRHWESAVSNTQSYRVLHQVDLRSRTRNVAARRCMGIFHNMGSVSRATGRFSVDVLRGFLFAKYWAPLSLQMVEGRNSRRPTLERVNGAIRGCDVSFRGCCMGRC